ncbi:hypothetical protein ABZ917_17075 [Nonomuraea wenchangensis]
MDTNSRGKALFAAMVLAIGTMGATATEAAAAAEGTSVPGCRLYRPDPHIVAGQRVRINYYFSCNNRRIRYVKVTLSLKRHRGGVWDAVETSYQFDSFQNPAQAGINTTLETPSACQSGKRYHGDITINVSLAGAQSRTSTVRGPSITCAR